MQQDETRHTKGYIFSKELRQYYFIYAKISMMILLCFIVFFLVSAIKQETDNGATYFIVAILIAFLVFLIVSWMRNRNLMNATYSVDLQKVSNTTEKNEIITVSLKNAIQTDFIYPFSLGKATIREKYVIISNEQICDLSGMNIYKAIREIWKANAVIVPGDKI